MGVCVCVHLYIYLDGCMPMCMYVFIAQTEDGADSAVQELTQLHDELFELKRRYVGVGVGRWGTC